MIIIKAKLISLVLGILLILSAIGCGLCYKKMNSIEQTNISLEKQVEDLNNSKNNLEKELESKQSSLEEKNKEIQTLKDKNEKQNKEIEKLNKKNKDLENKVRRSTTISRGDNSSYKNKMTFTSTFYCPFDNVSGMEHNGDASATASGLPPGPNVFAVDPTVIPMGSKMRVRYPNGEVRVGVAGDTGGLIKGYLIDTFVYTNKEAESRGREKVIIEWS